ncbi:MAG: hypothetical protein E7646_09695 [Ruminococcaceae bacterium]|nr:hypothetical protein [Oscillospiraceae bacterium]
MKKKDSLDIWVPIALELDAPTKESIVADVREQHRDYGIENFLLAFPSGGWRMAGYPPGEKFAEFARFFSQIAEELKKDGIHCGWWITATLLSGRSDEFSPMVYEDGRESLHANCPMDERFRKRFSEDIALFAEIAHPEIIVTEDDFSIHAGSSDYGCFCQRHMDEFNKRMGKSYGREELYLLLKGDTEESRRLLRAWRELIKDSLVLISRDIRRALDKKTPEIPVGYMQSGGADMDGDCTLEVSKALAGDKHTPFSRFYGTTYCAGSAKDLARVLYHPIYSKQHCPEVLPYHESDTFPHTEFFMSAGFLRAMMAIVYSAGFVGSTFQTQQLLDDPNEEKAYGKMFAEERRRFDSLYREVKKCKMRGVQICYDPFWNTARRYSKRPDPLWARPVGLFGIPYVTLPDTVSFWDVRQAQSCDDKTVMEYLSRGLILDGAAAAILCQRGYGRYLGATVEGNAMEGKALLDLAAREVLSDGYLPQLKGRHLPSPHMYAKGNNGKLRRIIPTEKGCQVLSRMVSFEGVESYPVVTRFENELGGRVGIFGVTLCDEDTNADNLSQSLYNYRRAAMMEDLVEWCGGDYASCVGLANVFTVMNEATDRESSGFFGLVTLVNLGEDCVEEPRLRLPKTWRALSKIELLSRDGSWTECSFKTFEKGVVLNKKLSFGEVFVVKII